MKTRPKENLPVEHEEISKKIEEMLGTLKERNKLISKYYKTYFALHQAIPATSQPKKESQQSL
jgi:hypothetical protein